MRNANIFNLMGVLVLQNFMAESEQELKNLLMSVKEESEKAGLKLNIRLCGRRRGWDVSREHHQNVYYLG